MLAEVLDSERQSVGWTGDGDGLRLTVAAFGQLTDLISFHRPTYPAVFPACPGELPAFVLAPPTVSHGLAYPTGLTLSF